MCTVIYIPLKNSVLFSSNRDEDPARKKAIAPAVYKSRNYDCLYPKDGAAGGSWIGLNETGNFVVLLNGGFAKHTRQTNYRKSRGLVVTEMLDSKNIISYWQHEDLKGIEPFTLVVYAQQKLHQLTWTGFEKHHVLPDPALPHIWSSSTLYSIEARKERADIFDRWLALSPVKSLNDLYRFLTTATDRDTENGFVMNRNEATRTCSISLIEITKDDGVFEYADLLVNKKSISRISFQNHLTALPLNSFIAP